MEENNKMAKDMDMDMNFSDAMDVDITMGDVDVTMADADISKLLNDTHTLPVSNPETPLQTPVKPHVRVEDELFIAADYMNNVQVNQVITPNQHPETLNSTFNCEDLKIKNNESIHMESKENGGIVHEQLNITSEVMNASVEGKKDLNSTFGVDNCVNVNGDTNGNQMVDVSLNMSASHVNGNAANMNLNSTFELPSENLNTNMADISSIQNISIIGNNLPVNLANSNVVNSDLSIQSKDSTAEVTVIANGTFDASRSQSQINVTQELSVQNNEQDAEEYLQAEGSSGHSSGNYQDVPEVVEAEVPVADNKVINEQLSTFFNSLTQKKRETEKTLENVNLEVKSIETEDNSNKIEDIPQTITMIEEISVQQAESEVISIENEVIPSNITPSLEPAAKPVQIEVNTIKNDENSQNITTHEEKLVESVETDVNLMKNEENSQNITTLAEKLVDPVETNVNLIKNEEISQNIIHHEEKLIQSVETDVDLLENEVSPIQPAPCSTNNENLEEFNINPTDEDNTVIFEDAEQTLPVVDPVTDVVPTQNSQSLPDITKSPQPIKNVSHSNSLMKTALMACHDAFQSITRTKTEDSPLNNSTMILFDQSGIASGDCLNTTNTKSSNLLDCTLENGTMMQMLQQEQEKVLQAANRMNEDKLTPAKETHPSILAENKENIKNATAGDRNEQANREKIRDKPRPSLLLQFDPLANLVNGKTEESKLEPLPIRTLPLAVTKSPKSSGRLLDVDLEFDVEHKKAMDAVNEEKMNLIQEVNRLKLELNQVKQENTTLTLEIQKREEVYLKAEANSTLRESQYELELKQLMEKLESAKEQNNNEELSEVKQELKQSQAEIKKLLEEIAHYKKIMNEYESTLSANNCEKEKLKTEHTTVTQHLAALEVSFSDTITKYDRCKEIIAGFSRNEETLKERLEKSNQIAIKYEERYETLKSHANSQLDKANKDLIAAKEAHRTEIGKLNTLIKRQEIKNASLQQTLEQKIAECTALASLCDEMTGSGMH